MVISIFFRAFKMAHMILPLLLLTLYTGKVAASQNFDMQVIGLFKDKVLVMIGDKQKVLKIGDTTDAGLTLIEASSKGAVFEHDGKLIKYNLSTQINSTYAKPADNEAASAKGVSADNSSSSVFAKFVRIKLDRDGRYITTIKINGKEAAALVDTGANVVSLSSALAKQLRIDYSKGEQMSAETAGGKASGHIVILDEVSIGNIKQKKVLASVLDGDDPAFVLLGMSFLQRVKIKFDGATKEMEIRE